MLLRSGKHTGRMTDLPEWVKEWMLESCKAREEDKQRYEEEKKRSNAGKKTIVDVERKTINKERKTR